MADISGFRTFEFVELSMTYLNSRSARPNHDITVISIGPFESPNMILELPNEDQKKGENQKKRTFSET